MVPFINIDKILHKCKQRIHRIGIELEGGWGDSSTAQSVIRDGSVNFDAIQLPLEEEREYINLRNIINRGDYHTKEQQTRFAVLHRRREKLRPRAVGEIPSPPLLVNVKEAKDPMFWENWLKQFFPSHFNETCGMHVHMSMRTVLTYQKLMEESYPATVIEYIRRWAEGENLPKSNPLWKRLAGKSEYCQLKHFPNEQARTSQKDYDKHRPGHRYTFIHYPFTRNGTVECRGLPMFECEQAKRAIRELLSITNAYLVATARKEEAFKAQLQIEDDQFAEDLSTTA